MAIPQTSQQQLINEPMNNTITQRASRNSIPIVPEHFGMIINGHNEALRNTISSSSFYNPRLSDLRWELDDSTMLHIAAKSGQLEIISFLLQQDQEILYCQNNKGDLPIHVAVRAGHLAVTKKFLDEQQTSEASVRSQLEKENNDKNTALHIALLIEHKDLARCLFDKDPLYTFCRMNSHRICPLYLAIEARFWDLVKDMLQRCASNEIQVILTNRRSVLLAVIVAKNIDELKSIEATCSGLVSSSDEKGRTMLHYAAQIGFLEGVEFLLEKHPALVYKPDNDGFFPIHMACKGGNMEVIQHFFSCSWLRNNIVFMKHMSNSKDQNILHVAAGDGQDDVVKYLLGRPCNEVEELINAKDIDGNTPLHLATMGYHFKVVFTLTSDERVMLMLRNMQGFTALDLTEEYSGDIVPSFRERMTWIILVVTNVPRSPLSMDQGSTTPYNLNGSQNHVNYPTLAKENVINSNIKYHDRFNILLLVSTLVATVTFAAGFTPPGGYNSTAHDKAMVSKAHRHAFQIYIISNTIAFYSSIFAVVTLIWANLDDLTLSLMSLNFALPSLGLALTMMLVAFMAGLFVGLHNVCNWLAIVVLVIGCVSLGAVLVVFIPLCPLTSIKGKFARYIFNIVFRLTLLACNFWSKDKSVH